MAPNEENKSALIITAGSLHTIHAKTAHGLIRSPGRFRIVGVVDHLHAGGDAGRFVDGKPRGIPIFPTFTEALARVSERPSWCVVGIATHGGALTEELRVLLREAASLGLSVVNGLHEFAESDPQIAEAARRTGARIVDIRNVGPKENLRFWSGEIYKVRAPRVAVLGMDCAIGKRTTTSVLIETLRQRGLRAEPVYTGQTGWLLGWQFGIILDALPNDFVSGELERAVCRCDAATSPDLIVIEGQSSLRNPCGPCGSELILSAAARGVILQHAPARRFFEGYEHLRLAIPPISEEVELIRLLGARTLCVTLNSEGLSAQELAPHRENLTQHLGVPVLDPLTDRERLADIAQAWREEERRREQPHR